MTTKNKEQIKTKPRELVGILTHVSERTLKVRVESKHPHPKYTKIIKTHKSYLADVPVADGKKDKETKDLVVGDEVLIQECKPLSSRKTWKFIKVTRKA